MFVSVSVYNIDENICRSQVFISIYNMNEVVALTGPVKITKCYQKESSHSCLL